MKYFSILFLIFIVSLDPEVKLTKENNALKPVRKFYRQKGLLQDFGNFMSEKASDAKDAVQNAGKQATDAVKAAALTGKEAIENVGGKLVKIKDMAVAIVTVSKCLYDAYQQFKSKEIQECGLKDFVDELEGIIEKADLDPKIMGPLWKKQKGQIDGNMQIITASDKIYTCLYDAADVFGITDSISKRFQAKATQIQKPENKSSNSLMRFSQSKISVGDVTPVLAQMGYCFSGVLFSQCDARPTLRASGVFENFVQGENSERIEKEDAQIQNFVDSTIKTIDDTVEQIASFPGVSTLNLDPSNKWNGVKDEIKGYVPKIQITRHLFKCMLESACDNLKLKVGCRLNNVVRA